MGQRWSNAARVTAVGALLIYPRISIAQIDLAPAADSGSCLARIPVAEMTRVGVYLSASVVIPTDTTRRLASPPALALSRATAWHVRDLLGAASGTVPSGEPVVTWRDSDGTLRITAHRAGRMSLAQGDGRPLRFSGGPGLLATGLTAALTAGLKFEWPAGVTSDSIVIELDLESESTETGAERRAQRKGQEPVFTVMKPWFEPTLQVREARISYPAAVPVHRVEGAVNLRFVVDSTGRVELDTVKDVWPAWRPRLTGAEGQYYEAFVQAVRRGLGSARFTPARVGGCPVKIWVAQRFEFKPAR